VTAILKVSKIRVDADFLEELACQTYADPILNDGALDYFEEGRPNKYE